MYLSALWHAPRRCLIDGALSKPLWPTSGLPPGDACLPASLALVLVPWPAIIPKFCSTVKPWLYCDDRSLRVSNTGTEKVHDERLQAALDLTAQLDGSIGLVENGKKRRLWKDHERVERLGLLHRRAALIMRCVSQETVGSPLSKP